MEPEDIDIQQHEDVEVGSELEFGGEPEYDSSYGDSTPIHSHQNAETDRTMSMLQEKIKYKLDSASFTGKYTDAEIDKLTQDVDKAQHEVTVRKNDVSNWESKVSLNNTKEHRDNGDYAHAVSKLNEAKSRYNSAVDHLNDAKSRLNNAL